LNNFKLLFGILVFINLRVLNIIYVIVHNVVNWLFSVMLLWSRINIRNEFWPMLIPLDYFFYVMLSWKFVSKTCRTRLVIIDVTNFKTLLEFWSFEIYHLVIWIILSFYTHIFIKTKGIVSFSFSFLIFRRNRIWFIMCRILTAFRKLYVHFI
jgi:hypothetical protein